LQRVAINAAPVSEVPPIVHDVLRSPGQSLDANSRAFMEPRFGHDFSGVRVHADARAAESARAVNALAYTVGRDVVFGVGQYAPSTSYGQRLLAHELTHVAQQGSSLGSPNNYLNIDPPDNTFERQASNVAKLVEENVLSTTQGPRSVKKNGSRSVMLQRQSVPPARRPPFDDEPVELRSVLEVSYAAGKFGCARGSDAADCYNMLDAGARIVLKSLFNRLNRYGLWGHVVHVWGIWTTGVGGAHFTVKDHVKFLDALLASAQFCIDSAAGGMLHRGATSVREISSSDSLHLSLGTSNQVSAHIDAISPAASRESNFRCRYDPTAAVAHIGREVVPLGIPGLQIFPEPRPTHGLPDRGEAPPDIIRFEIRF
jgi:hypothetical protein